LLIMNLLRATVGFAILGVLFTASALANAPPRPQVPAPVSAPPPPGFKPAGEVRSEKLTLPVQMKRADLAGEGESVVAKIVIPARLKSLPPPAGAPGKVGATENSPSRSLIAAAALSLAAVSVVFVLRGKKWSTTSKAAVLGVAGLLGLFGAAQADIAIPGQKRGPRPMPPPAEAKSMIIIEFSADVEEATLILPGK
jgi:hypothetical protein